LLGGICTGSCPGSYAAVRDAVGSGLDVMTKLLENKNVILALFTSIRERTGKAPRQKIKHKKAD
jgi:hypothetical protein